MKVALLSPYRSSCAPVMTHDSSALNRYTFWLASALAAQGVDVVVFAVDDGSGERLWQDGPIRVRHVCRRGSLALPLAVLRATCAERPDVVHVQHELFAYGGLASAFEVIALLAILSILRKPVVTTIHGVIPLDRVDREFVRLNGLRAPVQLVTFTWRTLLWAVAQASAHVAVHGESLRSSLACQYHVTRRTSVVPHGLCSEPPREQGVAANHDFGLTGAPKVLFFGFLSSYKGIDYLADEVARIRDVAPNGVVAIAGEIPQRLRGRGELRDAVEHLRRAPNVHMLGFIDDTHVSSLFETCDIVVFPYRVVMAASGALTLAIAHRRPCLLSREFSDFQTTPMAFDLVPGGLAAALQNVLADPARLDEILACQEVILREASWERVATRWAGLYRDVLERS
jgi:glycosyltransferase involved in cell wall biosynthesis